MEDQDVEGEKGRRKGASILSSYTFFFAVFLKEISLQLKMR